MIWKKSHVTRLAYDGIRTQDPWQSAPNRLANTLSSVTYRLLHRVHDKNVPLMKSLMITEPVYLLRCYNQDSRDYMHSSGTGRYTCLLSVKLWIIASQKHWQRVCDIVFLEISCDQIGLRWDSNPGPLTVGTQSPRKHTELCDLSTTPTSTR